MSIQVPRGKSNLPVKDSERLGGQLPEYYATKTEVDTSQAAADTSQVTADEAKVLADEAALLALGVR